MSETYNVCVFGAGPAGTAIALRLADLGVSVIVVDRSRKDKPWGGESFVGAIRHPLNVLGLWQRFCAAGPVAGYARLTAWGGLPWTQYSLFDQLGNLWHVDRSRFDSDLRQAVCERGVTLLSYQDFDELRRDGDRWRLKLDRRLEISTTYLVDATGRACAIARRLGVKPKLYDRLIGFTAHIARNHDPGFDHAMVIESTPNGWWYAAPVPQGHVLAFFTDPDLAPHSLPSSMRRVAAYSGFAQAEPGQGWLTVGDACAAHDPLCGWGVYRAMSNGILAADAIAEFILTGNQSLINQYLARCRDQFQQYLDGLRRHYSYEQRWITSPFWQRRTVTNSM